MTCKLCAADPNPKNSAPRDCAFDENGVFHTDNWSCASLARIRGQCTGFGCGTTQQTNELTLHSLPYWLERYDYETEEDAALDAGFIVLSTYKRRGKVGTAQVITDERTYPLTLELVEKVLKKCGVDGIVPKVEKETK
jgi:hypothetical protein